MFRRVVHVSLGCACIAAGLIAVTPARPAHASVPTGTSVGVSVLTGPTTVTFADAGEPPATAATDTPQDYGAASFDQRYARGQDQALEPQDHLPRPDATAVAVAERGFDGLSQLDQRLADGGHNRLAPTSDQALCVGNGFVLQGVRYAFRVFDTSGRALTDPISIGAFMGDGHEVISTNPLVNGPLHAEPRCLFDPDTGRFVVTVKRFHADLTTGEFTAGGTAVEIAVSRTGDPRADWDVYTLDTTADRSSGSPFLAGCPCYPTKPTVGADANGIYIGTSLVSLDSRNTGGNQLIGSRIYAISKRKLVSRTAAAAVTFTMPAPAQPFAQPTLINPEPAASPPGGASDSSANGTEYFIADCGPMDGLVFVLALTNTRALDDAAPALTLDQELVSVEPTPPAFMGIEQKPGPRPLADWIRQQQGGALPPLEFLSDTARCAQPVWAAGRLWGVVTTAVKTPSGTVRSGLAWMQLTPDRGSGKLTFSVAKQGYLVVNGNNAIEGSIAVDRTGHGILSFGLVGPDFAPSAAFAPLTLRGIGPATVVGLGTVPYDSWTGYQYFGSTDRRANWGEYSAATTDGDGHFWMAQTYTPDGPRAALSNWATRVAEIG